MAPYRMGNKLIHVKKQNSETETEYNLENEMSRRYCGVQT